MTDENGNNEGGENGGGAIVVKKKYKRKPKSMVTHKPHTEARIDQIVRLMVQCKFRTGETYKQLAKQWGITPDRVSDLTAIASKRVAAQMLDSDGIKAQASATLDKIISDCLNDNEARDWADERNMLQNRRLVVDTICALARLGGVDSPQKHEISGPGGQPIQSANVQAMIAGIPAGNVPLVLTRYLERQKAKEPTGITVTEKVEEDGAPDEGGKE